MLMPFVVRPEWVLQAGSGGTFYTSIPPGPHEHNRCGSQGNPMDVAAMTLARREYAIHGTNQQSSIGRFVSYGCLLVFEHDIEELCRRVAVRTRVVVE